MSNTGINRLIQGCANSLIPKSGESLLMSYVLKVRPHVWVLVKQFEVPLAPEVLGIPFAFEPR